MSPTNSSSSGWEPPPPEALQRMLPQYEITGILGRGGMAAVYRGRQIKLDRDVAIKVLPETFTKGADELNFAARFLLEARAMAKMDHPAIISVYDFGETAEGQLYFIMEFIDGMNIHQYLQHHGGSLPQEHAISITSHVLDALEYAHLHGVIHRDIKPANILLNREGRVKIADFGLAKRFGDGIDESLALTKSDVTVGTLDFVAPESYDSDRTPDHRADVYAIGVMLYQMLTGKLPRGNFRMPSEIKPEIDPRLDDIVCKAMAADPDYRYASASAVRGDLDRIQSNPSLRVFSGEQSDLVPAAVPVTSSLRKAEHTRHLEPVKVRSRFPLFFTLGVSCATFAGIAFAVFSGAFPVSPGIEGSLAGEVREFGGMEMVWCPSGDFLMGSPVSEAGRYEDETPHPVKLSRGFWLAKTETTQGQWEEVMGNNPSRFKGVSLPVESVSLSDVQGWLNEMNRRHTLPTGWKWDFPTEAQWEYACRAGTKEAYSGVSLEVMGWYDENGGNKTNLVATKVANPWGFYDMSGNVREWCLDWYGDYTSASVTDPAGPALGIVRVLRGGSWDLSAANCRSADRDGYAADDRNDDVGFRPAVVPSRR